MIYTALDNLLKNCRYVDVKCFTEEEAHSYLTKRNTNLKLKDVMHVSGQNLLLLSKLLEDKSQSVADYETKLKFFVEEEMKNNLCGLVKEDKKLKRQFFE